MTAQENGAQKPARTTAPLPGNPVAKTPGAGPYRVMVVDDSVVVRGLIVRSLDADPSIVVVASVSNGQVALDQIGRIDVEVVVLDIEMPVMDGLTALPKLLAKDPTLKIVMASTLTRRNAEVSLKALEFGAADYVAKPSSANELRSAADFQRELVSKVKIYASRRRLSGKSSTAAVPSPAGAGAKRRPGEALAGAAVRRPVGVGEIKLRQRGFGEPLALAIGSSTGGPQALMAVMAQLPAKLGLPVFITQHMPPTFTTILAEHINRTCKLSCSEARDGEIVEPDHVYVAPGDYHLGVAVEGTIRVIRLSQNPPLNFCRPAVDYMLDSLVPAYHGRVLTAILTGMGQDGMLGSRTVIQSGGSVIAQDEATSVVWGMPGAVAVDGSCTAVLPLAEIGRYLVEFLGRRAA